MELKNSKTEANLMAAYSGESQARNKYTYYAGVAKNEGYEQIAAIFRETADNEKEHAEIWFKLLGGIGDTKANLLAGVAGEIMSGRSCTISLPKRQMRRALPRSLPNSGWWLP